MLRRITVTAAAAVLIPTAAPAVHARPEGPCRGYEWQTSTHQTRRMIRCVWNRFNVGHGGPPMAIRVGSCESGLRWWATRWPYVGLYQHSSLYWDGRFSRFVRQNPLRRTWHLSDSPFNGRTQAIVTGLMVRAGGWSPWSCA
jgi:hypothetical protein